MRAHLTILKGSGEGARFTFPDKNALVLGRHPKCDLRIKDSHISNIHCHIYQEGAHYYIEDLDSKNGTVLNSDEIKAPSRLANNDMISMGDTILRFTLESEEREPPPVPKRPVQKPKKRTRTQMTQFPNTSSPKRIGDYSLIEKIGGGGSGEIFKAHHLTTKKIVALKILRSYDLEEASMKRFIHEVQICMELNHPMIVKVFDFGVLGDSPVIAMEYIEGLPLDEYVAQEGAFKPKQALRVAANIAHGLYYAHKRNVIHRDLKPSNVVFEKKRNAIKIIDFGLAKICGKSITMADQMLGTIRYIPPEQVDDAHSVDVRADIYSLGALLYHILCGKPPYFHIDGLNALIFNITTNPPIPLRDIITIPDSLADLVERAMAQNREKRYRTAKEFFKAVIDLLKLYETEIIK